MISELPALRLPDCLVRVCSLDLLHARNTYTDILEIIESDKFLDIFVQEAFSAYLKKGGVVGMLSALGYHGFRNRLAEAYLFHARYGKFPQAIELDDVLYAVDLEKRFDFLLSEPNGQVFLLGTYLKLCEIHFEREGDMDSFENLIIPPEVDEILMKGKSKNINVDWLIILVWEICSTLGHAEAKDVLAMSKGNMDIILSKISSSQYKSIIYSLLRYGTVTNEFHFFTMKKV